MTILNQIIKLLRKEFKKLPDKRGRKHVEYAIEDIALSAFSLFYFQSKSWLDFQRNMFTRTGKSNAKSFFGIEKIPSDNHIRDVLDDIRVEQLQPIFDGIYHLLLKKETLQEYQYFDRTLLVLLDGTYYHSSRKIHCAHCQTKTKSDAKGKMYTEYYHSAITPIIAHPKSNQVLSLFPEVISNKDGEDKQDCEINAYIEKLGELDSKVVTKSNRSRKKETYRYAYLNDVDLTGDKDSIKVNWCRVEVTDEKKKIVYSGAFATDYTIDDHNVEKIVEAGRARWKVENENNNTLKTGGYHLAHNFGHGKEGLSELLFTLNLLSFLTHTISLKHDEGYQKLYELINNRQTFFGHITTFTTFFYIPDFDTLWHKMIEGYVDGLHLDV